MSGDLENKVNSEESSNFVKEYVPKKERYLARDVLINSGLYGLSIGMVAAAILGLMTNENYSFECITVSTVLSTNYQLLKYNRHLRKNKYKIEW